MRANHKAANDLYPGWILVPSTSTTELKRSRFQIVVGRLGDGGNLRQAQEAFSSLMSSPYARSTSRAVVLPVAMLDIGGVRRDDRFEGESNGLGLVVALLGLVDELGVVARLRGARSHVAEGYVAKVVEVIGVVGLG